MSTPTEKDVARRLDLRINGCGIRPMLADVDLMRAALVEIRALRTTVDAQAGDIERLRGLFCAAMDGEQTAKAELAALRSEGERIEGWVSGWRHFPDATHVIVGTDRKIAIRHGAPLSLILHPSPVPPKGTDAAD